MFFAIYFLTLWIYYVYRFFLGFYSDFLAFRGNPIIANLANWESVKCGGRWDGNKERKKKTKLIQKYVYLILAIGLAVLLLATVQP